MGQFDDIEVATFNSVIGIEAANLNGATGFAGGDFGTVEGSVLIDYDEIVDRNESLHLLTASHRMTAYLNSTSSEDGTVRGYAEISATPNLTLRSNLLPGSQTGGSVTGDVVGASDTDDTIDVVGRPLDAVGHAPFTDTTTGFGGGGSAGEDTYDGDQFPAEFGNFHPRDELFLNASFEVWNTQDAGVHMDVTGQHVYGVMED